MLIVTMSGGCDRELAQELLVVRRVGRCAAVWLRGEYSGKKRDYTVPWLTEGKHDLGAAGALTNR